MDAFCCFENKQLQTITNKLQTIYKYTTMTDSIIIPAISTTTTAAITTTSGGGGSSSSTTTKRKRAKKHKKKRKHKKKQKVATPTCSFCDHQGHTVTTCAHPALKALEGKPLHHRRFLRGRYFYKQTPLKLKVYKCLRGHENPHNCSRGAEGACEECVFVLRMIMILKARMLEANPEAKGENGGKYRHPLCRLTHEWVVYKPNMTTTYEFGCPGIDKHVELCALAQTYSDLHTYGPGSYYLGWGRYQEDFLKLQMSLPLEAGKAKTADQNLLIMAIQLYQYNFDKAATPKQADCYWWDNNGKQSAQWNLTAKDRDFMIGYSPKTYKQRDLTMDATMYRILERTGEIKRRSYPEGCATRLATKPAEPPVGLTKSGLERLKGIDVGSKKLSLPFANMIAVGVGPIDIMYDQYLKGPGASSRSTDFYDTEYGSLPKGLIGLQAMRDALARAYDRLKGPNPGGLEDLTDEYNLGKQMMSGEWRFEHSWAKFCESDSDNDDSD